MLRSRRAWLTLLGTAAAAASLAAPAAHGYNTPVTEMLTLLPAAPGGATQDALLTGGEATGLHAGYVFESIPDGVAVMPKGNGLADVYVNHETSTVPFPYNSPWGGSEANQNDYKNSELSKLLIHGPSNDVQQASLAIRTWENFQRFCSNFLATATEGFEFPLLLTSEEAQDWVFRTHTAWPGPEVIPPATTGAEQSGAVVAYNPATGQRKAIYGLGRLNHENTVAIPGFQGVVMLTTDDTFQTATTAPGASSQLYMYRANSAADVWNDKGTLYAFRANGTDNDYFDLQVGETISGNFVPVPKDIARGKSSVDGHELTRAVDFPSYPAPAGGPSVPPDGPQWVLDQWGNEANSPSVAHNDVFDFIRLEDLAYDKRPGMSNHVYIADSGRATSGAANPNAVSSNGRIYTLELDPARVGNPLHAEISILVQGDDNPVASTDAALSFNEIHQPDNVETTVHGNLLVTEDPSSANQYALPRGANETPARLWRVPLFAANPDASKVAIAEVNQLLDENQNPALGPLDVDGTNPAIPAPANLGNWESSGIVDVSKAFGQGTFLVTIQAHSYWTSKTAGPDAKGNAGVDYWYKSEGGQLILLRLPGI
jgi:hypothetical protein